MLRPNSTYTPTRDGKFLVWQAGTRTRTRSISPIFKTSQLRLRAGLCLLTPSCCVYQRARRLSPVLTSDPMETWTLVFPPLATISFLVCIHRPLTPKWLCMFIPQPCGASHPLMHDLVTFTPTQHPNSLQWSSALQDQQI